MVDQVEQMMMVIERAYSVSYGPVVELYLLFSSWCHLNEQLVHYSIPFLVRSFAYYFKALWTV